MKWKTESHAKLIENFPLLTLFNQESIQNWSNPPDPSQHRCGDDRITSTLLFCAISISISSPTESKAPSGRARECRTRSSLSRLSEKSILQNTKVRVAIFCNLMNFSFYGFLLSLSTKNRVRNALEHFSRLQYGETAVENRIADAVPRKAIFKLLAHAGFIRREDFPYERWGSNGINSNWISAHIQSSFLYIQERKKLFVGEIKIVKDSPWVHNLFMKT